MGIYTLIISDYIIPHSELFTAARRNSWPIPSIYELICVYVNSFTERWYHNFINIAIFFSQANQ